jgi:hemolysin III
MRTQTLGEEIANSVTHGIGFLLSIAGLVILIVTSLGNARAVASFSIFGTTLVMLYLASTLYHSISHDGAKRILEIFDHNSIYFLIAGSYTPIALLYLRGAWGWTIFALVWGIAIVGIFLCSFANGRFQLFRVVSYIAMGWLIVIAINPLKESCSASFILWLLMGGLSYTFGTIFYAWKKLPYHHTIWHLFVLGGSFAHFFGMLLF